MGLPEPVNAIWSGNLSWEICQLRTCSSQCLSLILNLILSIDTSKTNKQTFGLNHFFPLQASHCDER